MNHLYKPVNCPEVQPGSIFRTRQLCTFLLILLNSLQMLSVGLKNVFLCGALRQKERLLHGERGLIESHHLFLIGSG